MKNCKLNKGGNSGFNNNLTEQYLLYNSETQKTMLHIKSNLGHWKIVFIKEERDSE